MVSYVCDRCKREFSRKSTFNDHLARKNPCQSQLNVIQNDSQTAPKHRPIINSIKALAGVRLTPVRRLVKKEHRCQHCDMSFSKSSNLSRHHTTCPVLRQFRNTQPQPKIVPKVKLD